jgi:hypothetical protein
MNPRALLAVVFCFTFSLWSEDASATLLFSGGEDVDFTCIGGCPVTTDVGYYRSAWAREAVGTYGSTNDPPPSRLATSVFTANATLWIHAQFLPNGGGQTEPNIHMVRVLDTNGNAALIIRGTGTNGRLKISSRTAAGSYTDLVTCSSALLGSLQQLDFYINYGSSGEVALYNNSVQVCDFTGNVTNGDGATALNKVEFSAPWDNIGGNTYWSEVIVATTDTRAMSRFSANTVANGNTTGFTGTNICSSIWNSASFNDSNYGYTGSNNVVHECTIKSTVPAGTYNVQGLVMSARGLVGTAGPQHFDFVTRTGGTDYTSPDFAPITSPSNILNYIQTTNPATSSPWSLSDFQNSGFNIGAESKP